MAIGTVQFRGKASVLKAYANRKLCAWSLWVNKQFLFKYASNSETEALEMLEEHLEMLFSDGSTAIYTLKVYEDITDIKQIKEKTEADGSFNFRLQEVEEYRPGNRNNELLSRIAALEKQISEGEEDSDEEEGGVLGQITTAMQNPIIAGLVERITGIKFPAQAVAISGIAEPGEQDRLTNEAIAILKTKDTLLGTHLSKLSKIANSNIDNYNYLISLLEQVKVD